MLAVEGGTPVRTKKMAPWPVFGVAEQEAAARVLRSGQVNYWTGAEGRAFEDEFASYCGRAHGIVLANGTVALELALEAFGVGDGDDVVVASRTFMATGSAVVARRARPVFAEVDFESGNVTSATVEAALTPRTRAVIVVHVGGWPCDMDPIVHLAEDRGIRLIEDCAQANGAAIGGRRVGSFGDASAFSFCQDKILTTAGEGGMLLLDDAVAFKRAWAYKDHGKSYDAVYHRKHPPGFRWLHESFGTNWRLSEVQSAVGRVGLRQLDDWVEVRRRNASLLDAGFRDVPGLHLHQPSSDLRHAYYRYYASIVPEQLVDGWTRERIVQAICAEGIPAFSGSCSEIYLEKAYDGLRPVSRFPNARRLGELSLAFLVHPTLDEIAIQDICEATRKVMRVAARP